MMIEKQKRGVGSGLVLMVAIIVLALTRVVAGECRLNWSTGAYRYVKYKECEWVKEEMKEWEWEGFPKTVCCRNTLTALTQALALYVDQNESNKEGGVFLSKDEWSNCTAEFEDNTPISCGLQSLYSGSTQCSNVRVQDIKGQQPYLDALDQCSHFDHPFLPSCTHCTTAIFAVRNFLYDQFVGKEEFNPLETAVCGVAALVSLAAANSQDPSLIDKFLRCFPLSPPSQDRAGFFKSASLVAVLVMGVLLGGVAVVVVMILVKYVLVSSKNKRPKGRARLKKEITTWSGMYWFSKAEIENAMMQGAEVGGNEKKCLGRGSAGQVYKGVLPSGQVVAIKHLNTTNTSDTFTREVQGLSRLRHPNLVCLFGCCIEDGHRYLVYEYCAEGNLAQHLLRRHGHILTWLNRVQILRDCSFALKYLHHHMEGCVVHRDIKLTNILLTENLQAKLSDFGLAKMLGMEESKVFTDVRGTIGYMDPEYMSNAKLTCASDIYSFGIVALQILSGQKVIELDLDARDQLTRKARDVSIGKRPLSDFEDPRLQGQVNKEDFEAILQIAVLCVAKSSKGRPTIEVVFEELDKAYKNTLAQSRAKHDRSTSGTSTSRSLDFTPG